MTDFGIDLKKERVLVPLTAAANTLKACKAARGSRKALNRRGADPAFLRPASAALIGFAGFPKAFHSFLESLPAHRRSIHAPRSLFSNLRPFPCAL